VDITAKVTMDAVAKVAATGSAPVNGTTKNSIDAAGKNALPISAIGMRTVSSSWNRAWVRVNVVIGHSRSGFGSGLRSG